MLRQIAYERATVFCEYPVRNRKERLVVVGCGIAIDGARVEKHIVEPTEICDDVLPEILHDEYWYHLLPRLCARCFGDLWMSLDNTVFLTPTFVGEGRRNP
ncbi:MAG: hypothetical protein J0H49_13515 [Acidobacteria bacterium]|nr:hypothetical protein [Acidobacteriota bacterium]